MAAVKRTNALQAAENVRHMAAEHAAVLVHLIDDHVAQRGKEPAPARMGRQDAHMEHIRIGDDDASAVTRARTLARRRIAIVGGRRPGQAKGLEPRGQNGQLVVGERPGGEEIQRVGFWLAEEAVQHGQVVAQRLAGGGRRDHGYVLPGKCSGDGFRLMDIKAGDLPGGEQTHQPLVQGGWHGPEHGRLPGQRLPGRDVRTLAIADPERGQRPLQVRFLFGAVGCRPYAGGHC